MNEEIDGAIAFYHSLNTCPGCQRPIYSATEMSAMLGVPRRTLFRWLAGNGSARVHAKITRWLVENNPLPVRHG